VKKDAIPSPPTIYDESQTDFAGRVVYAHSFRECAKCGFDRLFLEAFTTYHWERTDTLRCSCDKHRGEIAGVRSLKWSNDDHDTAVFVAGIRSSVRADFESSESEKRIAREEIFCFECASKARDEDWEPGATDVDWEADPEAEIQTLRCMRCNHPVKLLTEEEWWNAPLPKGFDA
jgi:hypothetical protein